MKYYYSISLFTALLIGTFGTDPVFNPFASEQENGRFIIPVPVYESLKNTEQFQRVNWDTIPVINQNQLQPKIIE